MSVIGALFARLLSAALVAVAVALLAIGMLGWLDDVAGPGSMALGPGATPGAEDVPSGEPTAGTSERPTQAPARTSQPFMPSSEPTLVSDPTAAATTDPDPTVDPTAVPEPTVDPTVDPTAIPISTAVANPDSDGESDGCPGTAVIDGRSDGCPGTDGRSDGVRRLSRTQRRSPTRRSIRPQGPRRPARPAVPSPRASSS